MALKHTLSKTISDPDFERNIFSDEPPRWLLDNAEAFPENGNNHQLIENEGPSNIFIQCNTCL